jgi:hypothetical protein
MMRVFTATCFAAALAVGLSAQQQTAGTTGSTDLQQGRGGPRTVTGCLRAGDTAGTYMLTDVQMAGRSGDTTGSTAGSTTGTSTTGSTQGATGRQGRGMMPTTLNLSAASDVDLKAHVGHKIEVTGTMAGGGRRGGDAAGSTTTGGTTTGGTATTSGTTSATGGQGGGQGRTRTMNVTSVRMVSESCS